MGRPADLVSRALEPLQRKLKPTQRHPLAPRDDDELSPESVYGEKIEARLAYDRNQAELKAFEQMRTAREKAQKDFDDQLYAKIRARTTVR